MFSFAITFVEALVEAVVESLGATVSFFLRALGFISGLYSEISKGKSLEFLGLLKITFVGIIIFFLITYILASISSLNLSIWYPEILSDIQS